MRRFRIGLLVGALMLVISGVAAAAAQHAVRAAKATSVSATEVEWRIKLSKASAPHGKVTFIVRDAGHLAHQFIVLQTKLSQGELPMKGSIVNLKKAGKVIGKISLAPGKGARLTVTLAKGPYVILCNLPAHYQSGQHTAFRAT